MSVLVKDKTPTVEGLKAIFDYLMSKINIVKEQKHDASDIVSGTLDVNRLPIIPISKGGFGATTAKDALINLGITATAAEINKLDGTTVTKDEINQLKNVKSNVQSQIDNINEKIEEEIVPISRGGTGATNVASARNALGLGNTSGALPVENGGTGSTTAKNARLKLGAQEQHIPITITLFASGWTDNSIAVNVDYVTELNTVIIAPAPESYIDYGECGIYCFAQNDGELVFMCDYVPEKDVMVNVIIFANDKNESGDNTGGSDDTGNVSDLEMELLGGES